MTEDVRKLQVLEWEHKKKELTTIREEMLQDLDSTQQRAREILLPMHLVVGREIKSKIAVYQDQEATLSNSWLEMMALLNQF